MDMDINSVCKTIDLNRREFSLLLVNPKTSFIDWLADFAQQKGWTKYRMYSDEENAVLIIPKVNRFSMPGSLGQFLKNIKPKLLLAELSRFRATPSDFGRPITDETFDAFFDVHVRDSALFMSDLTITER
jgi:hypothetical protein